MNAHDFLRPRWHLAPKPFVCVHAALDPLVEIALAALLFMRRTRAWACIAACAFVFVVQSMARELMFGIEFAGAISLFARTDLIRRAVWPVAGMLAVLCLMRLGVLSEVTFH